MSNPCAHCEKPTELKVCWNCAKLARRLLLGEGDGDDPGIVWLYDRLTESAYGQARMQAPGPRGKSAEIPGPGLNLKASNLRKAIHTALIKWQAEIAGPVRTSPESIATIVPRLASDMQRLMAADCTAEMIKTLQRHTRQALEVIDRRSDEYFGPCTATVNGVVCGEDLRSERGATSVECRRCHAILDVEAVREDALRQVDMTPQSASDLLRLLRWLGRKTPPRSTFYAVLGRVAPRMYQRKDGRVTLTAEPGATALYAYGDVVDALEARTKQKKAS